MHSKYRPQWKRKEVLLKVFFLLIGFLMVIGVSHVVDIKIKDSPPPTPAPMRDIFKERKTYVKEMCEKYSLQANLTTKDVLLGLSTPGGNSSTDLSLYQMQHMFVDHKHKLLYCFVPKAGCTNWKRIMLMLTGKQNVSSPLDIPRSYSHMSKYHDVLYKIDQEQRDYILANYTKFMAVRDPLERLLSAYMNKFESKTAPSKFFHKEMGSKIIKAYRPNATPKEINEGSDVTFPEFVRYVTESNFSLISNHNQSFNEHWESMHALCNPCVVQYHYIARFENLVNESNEILKRINSSIRYPTEGVIKPSGTKEKMKRYFDEIPVKNIRMLEKIYRFDSLVFNYSMKEAIGLELS